jgi:hypothetical protein
MKATWRGKARPIIAGVIARVGTADMASLRKALRAAYPFGPRENFPYKVWCDEVRKQLGTKPTKDKTTPCIGQKGLWP